MSRLRQRLAEQAGLSKFHDASVGDRVKIGKKKFKFFLNAPAKAEADKIAEMLENGAEATAAQRDALHAWVQSWQAYWRDQREEM